MNSDAKYKWMTQESVSKLILTLSVPTIVSMLISALYNMADTFFVSKIGTSATGAVGIAFSLMAIMQAVGFTLGMGAGNFISRLLGQKNMEDAQKVAATSFFTSFGVGVIFTVIGLIFINPLVNVLGATPTIFPYARDYVSIILFGAPFIISSYVLNNIFRYQGSAYYSMFGIGIGSLINIGLDPLFIFTFGMGTAGAALATVISQIISFFILLYMCTKGGNIKIKFKNFTPKWDIYKEVLRTGMPSFYRQGLASLATMALNLSAGRYGDAAIAAMSIVGRVFHFAFAALLGFGQGYQPVCGFNFGAKLYKRVLDGFWFCIKVSVVALTVISIIGFIFAPQIISAFRKEDLEVISIGTKALRLQCITFPLASWIVINNMLLQTIGKSREASILSFARQGLFFIPIILLLPHLIGLLGIQLAQPISDVATLILSIPMGLKVLEELKTLEESEWAISSDTYTYTYTNTDTDSDSCSGSVSDFDSVSNSD